MNATKGTTELPLIGFVSAGLDDEVSTVRYAASVTARTVCQVRPDLAWQDNLAPGICLNRFYPADGVRACNCDAWAKLSAD